VGKQILASRLLPENAVKNSEESRLKLTAQNVRTVAAPDGKADFIAWDDSLPGFGVRVRGSNRTYVVQYRASGQQRRESLGDVRRITLQDARDIARKRFAQVELGGDPGAERAAERAEKAKAANKAALALSAVASRHLDATRNSRAESSIKGAERHFSVHFAPLANRPIGEIKRAEIAAQLQVITRDYGVAAAARARSILSAMYSWAMGEGLCESNPVIGTNNPGKMLQSRDRVLIDAELAAVWRAATDDDFGKIVKLLILTGCRRDEISALRWDEINGSGMTISAARSKNRRPHSLILPPMAMEILASVPRRGEYVFGKNGKGFARWSFWKEKLDERLLGQMSGDWRLHDLRRSPQTGMAEIGIAPHIVEAVLNHVSGHKGGVAGVYNRAGYTEPMRVALQRWADHIAAIVEQRDNDNVVPLRA
jgi:integrase